MALDKAYYVAEKKIGKARRSGATELSLSDMSLTEVPESLGQLSQLQSLDLSGNQLTALPDSLGQLSQLQSLDIHRNQISALPEWLGQFTYLEHLNLCSNRFTEVPKLIHSLVSLRVFAIGNNQITEIPYWIGDCSNLRILNLGDDAGGNPLLLDLPFCIRNLKNLEELLLSGCKIKNLPEWLRHLTKLKTLYLTDNSLSELPWWIGQFERLEQLQLRNNHLTDIPASLARSYHLEYLSIDKNPLNLELTEANEQGLDAVKAYLRAKAEAQIILNEAKLILVGEGEVGKSCLLGALRGDLWEEGRSSTHGIEIKPVTVTAPDNGKEITLNGWDFGGQRVYRPTHQLFFSAPAVYLVVWKPREGPQQGFVKEWLQLVKRREPDAKILVVATHGGPQQRQPDIDRQELWDLFGKDTVLDFFFVESKPDENGERRGIAELRQAIARIAASLPEMGRSVPKSFQEVWQALRNTGAAYLPLEQVLAICREHRMDADLARLFVTISHRLGHIIHYEHDLALRDIVVLKPDWLATAISYVLDDAVTRSAHGLVRLSHLSRLWFDPSRAADTHYPAPLHPIFLRLMERFDLSYRVADISPNGDSDPQSLIAQLVPDNRPETDLAREWSSSPASGDLQQVQICRIVDDKGQSANAEGLFYQLIVRLHKFSLGRANYIDSVHWQRGLVLDDDYNGRALLEHAGYDVRITVRAPYPERFLAMLTGEVKYLVGSFWEGLRCDVMVPCIEPCGKNNPGTGLFEVQKLIESKKRSRPDYPCPVCSEWQDIDCLLRNAPAARPAPIDELLASHVALREFRNLRHLLVSQQAEAMGRFDNLDARQRELLSKADASFTDLIQALNDEAKEGPRLFSLRPVDPGFLDRPKWISQKFHLVLWCEHSRLPLFILNDNPKSGVYMLDLPREWVVKAAPLLKTLTVTLSLILPVASSATKLVMDQNLYEQLENQLDFGKDCFDSFLEGSEKVGEWLSKDDSLDLAHTPVTRAEGAILRELQVFLKKKDPGFGGLVRVMNKHQKFLWVHPQFEGEY